MHCKPWCLCREHKMQKATLMLTKACSEAQILASRNLIRLERSNGCNKKRNTAVLLLLLRLKEMLVVDG
jgi:hypothetical protein